MRRIIFLCSIFLLTACHQQPITSQQVNHVTLGQTPDQVEKILATKPTQTTTVDDFYLQAYPFVVGSQTRMEIVCDRQNPCHPITTRHNKIKNYLFVYEKDPQSRLIAWGLYDDLAQSSDKDIRQLMVKLEQKGSSDT